jgi:hypothetical protein
MHVRRRDGLIQGLFRVLMVVDGGAILHKMYDFMEF